MWVPVQSIRAKSGVSKSGVFFTWGFGMRWFLPQHDLFRFAHSKICQHAVGKPSTIHCVRPWKWPASLRLRNAATGCFQHVEKLFVYVDLFSHLTVAGRINPTQFIPVDHNWSPRFRRRSCWPSMTWRSGCREFFGEKEGCILQSIWLFHIILWLVVSYFFVCAAWLRTSASTLLIYIAKYWQLIGKRVFFFQESQPCKSVKPLEVQSGQPRGFPSSFQCSEAACLCAKSPMIAGKIPCVFLLQHHPNAWWTSYVCWVWSNP